jgi:ankyrin repeat protein
MQVLLEADYNDIPALIDALNPAPSLDEWIEFAFYVIKINHTGLLDRLLNYAKVPILATDENGWTFLHAAVHECSLELVDYLIRQAGYTQGRRLFLSVNEDGDTPLTLAVKIEEEHEDIMDIISSLIHADFVHGSSNDPVILEVAKAAGIAYPHLADYMNLLLRGKQVLFHISHTSLID